MLHKIPTVTFKCVGPRYGGLTVLCHFTSGTWASERGFPGGASGEEHTQETQETRVHSLGLEAPLEKEMATHFSILAWRIPQTEEPGGLQSIGLTRVTRLKWFSMHPRASKNLASAGEPILPLANRYWRKTKAMKSDMSAYPFSKSDSDKYQEKKIGVRE